MSRIITKLDASKVAVKMIENISFKIIEKKNEVSDIVSEIYLKSLPKEVSKTYKIHSQYFNKLKDIRCEGNGLNDSFNLKQSLPSDGSWQKCIMPTEQEAVIIIRLSEEINNLEVKRSNLKNSIEKTLLSLRSYNRIKKDFPEAYDLLPKYDETDKSLMIPIQQIMSELAELKP